MKENNVISEKSSFANGKVDNRAEDSALTKDESVWIAYNAVNPKVVARLNEIELVNPRTRDPENKAVKGMTAAITLNTATISLSNFAILKALLVNSKSPCASLSG
jgi:hypothetical protein